MKHLKKYESIEPKKSKRKIGSFAIHCIGLGYTGAKGEGGRCSGSKNKKRKVFQGYKLPLEFGKDYYYDKKNENIDSVSEYYLPKDYDLDAYPLTNIK